MDLMKFLLSICLFLVAYFLPILISKIVAKIKQKKELKGE